LSQLLLPRQRQLDQKRVGLYKLPWEGERLDGLDAGQFLDNMAYQQAFGLAKIARGSQSMMINYSATAIMI
jgi:hypothetical protein